MLVDSKVSEYFKNIKQVFLYLGDSCNLRCKQCLYKPNIILGKHIEPQLAKSLLYEFKKLGAFKLSVLGGEVSLYDIDNNRSGLIEILNYAKFIGYTYIRIDTNGQCGTNFFDESIIRNIDEISFSIDGYNELTNDVLRGFGTFKKAEKNLKFVTNLFDKPIIQVTSCVARQNTEISGGIINYIDSMVNFCVSCKVEQLNLHGVFKMGVPMDTWTENSHLDPKVWFESIKKIEKRIEIGYYPIHIRLPLHVITYKQFDENPEYYGYCPCKLGERALIHPDGLIRVCSSMLSTPYSVALYNNTSIIWNDFSNELSRHKFNQNTPCTNQTELYTEQYCPICFSIKPKQNEPVWRCSQMELKKKI